MDTQCSCIKKWKTKIHFVFSACKIVFLFSIILVSFFCLVFIFFQSSHYALKQLVKYIEKYIIITKCSFRLLFIRKKMNIPCLIRSFKVKLIKKKNKRKTKTLDDLKFRPYLNSFNEFSNLLLLIVFFFSFAFSNSRSTVISDVFNLPYFVIFCTLCMSSRRLLYVMDLLKMSFVRY